MHPHRHGPRFDLPIAALAAGWAVRVAVLLPLIALLWLAVFWALVSE
jgi:hypothetical protein